MFDCRVCAYFGHDMCRECKARVKAVTGFYHCRVCCINYIYWSRNSSNSLPFVQGFKRVIKRRAIEKTDIQRDRQADRSVEI